MEKFMYETEKMEVLKCIFDHMQDEESRQIYLARSCFSLSDDRKYMQYSIKNMVVSKVLYEGIAKHSKQKKVLFGAGTWGKAITELLDDIKWDYVVDNNRVGSEINGYKIDSVSKIDNIRECFIVVGILFKYREVVEQLKKLGVMDKNILILAEVAESNQYFDLPDISFTDNEVFIDAGGFNGDTSRYFVDRVDGKYEQIYVFEPDMKQAKECKNNLADLENIVVIQKATWDKKEILNFVTVGEGSHIEQNELATNSIETITIDEVLNGDKATYIKMDVEGAEYKSLIGAQNTIKKYYPKLAISVYHKRDDIWKIPMLLLKYNPNYKFYLRMYSFTGNDTVLYAL